MTQLTPGNLFRVSLRGWGVPRYECAVLLNAESGEKAVEIVQGTPEIRVMFSDDRSPTIRVKKADVFDVQAIPTIESLVAQLRGWQVKKDESEAGSALGAKREDQDAKT